VQYYLSSFGPVTERDIVWWTGLNKIAIQEALKKLKEQIVNVQIKGFKDSFIMLESDRIMNVVTSLKSQAVNLLPALDSYVMGYKDRERYLSAKYYAKVFDRSGNATSTILFGDKIVGVWDIKEDKEPSVKILLFDKIKNTALIEICSKAQKIGKFITGKEVQIRECSSMVPLVKRTAGGFMSPLRYSE
jgi:hypothetical protein